MNYIYIIMVDKLSVVIKDFKDSLHIKSKNGVDYYYVIVKTPFFKKEYYLGKYVDDEKTLLLYQQKLNIKIHGDILEFIVTRNKKTFKANYISDDDYFKLEFLRFGYNNFLKQFSKPDLDKYESIVYTKYVYGTTNVEGNTYSLRDTQLTLNDGLTVAGKKKREFFEIENYSKLKEYLLKKKKFSFDVSFIKKVHSFILRNIDENSAGELRKVDVFIGGTEFVPVPGILVEDELNKLVDWYSKNLGKIYPVELIALFHQKFEEIHPFPDGNGRVGRELARLMLNTFGYPSIFIGPKEREEYLKCLDSGNDKKHSPMVKFFVDRLIEANYSIILDAKSSLETTLKSDSFSKLKVGLATNQLKLIKKKLSEIPLNHYED